VTCEAAAEGLVLVKRGYFPAVRELMALLEEQGLGAEMEKIPPARAEDRQQASWNLYVPEADLERAVEFLRADFSHLLQDPGAAAAAARGDAEIDLDAGGEVDCPACGQRFVLGAAAECPECGLSLAVPGAAGETKG
jgi:hypothetical protein